LKRFSFAALWHAKDRRSGEHQAVACETSADQHAVLVGIDADRDVEMFVDEVSETVQLARTSRRFFDPPDRDQAVEDVDDELGRGAWLRTRLASRRSAPCAYQVTDAQRWLGPPVSRCLR